MTTSLTRRGVLAATALLAAPGIVRAQSKDVVVGGAAGMAAT